MIILSELSNNAILILASMLDNVQHSIEHESVDEMCDDLMRDVYVEIEKRKLNPKYTIYDDFGERFAAPYRHRSDVTIDENFDLSKATDDELLFVEMVAAEIEDYSCLGYQVRPYVDSFWDLACDELEKRKIKKEAFCMMELKF